MTETDLRADFLKLDQRLRYVLQLSAIAGESLNHVNLGRLWRDAFATEGLAKKELRSMMESLLSKGFLSKESYSSVAIVPQIRDVAAQDAVCTGTFDAIADAVLQRDGSNSWMSPDDFELRIAFYRNDVEEFREEGGHESPYELGVLDPFNREIFDGLDPYFQKSFLLAAVPGVIRNPAAGKDVLSAWDGWSDLAATTDWEQLAVWLDLGVARGDLDLLEQLDRQTGGKQVEIAGCMALLRGDYEQATAKIGAVMPGGKKRSKLGPLTHLPVLLHLLLLLREYSDARIAEARAALNAAERARKANYACCFPMFSHAYDYLQAPSDPAVFAAQLQKASSVPLTKLLAGLVMRWLVPNHDPSRQINSLGPVVTRYNACALNWLAAETAGLIGKSRLKSAAKNAQRQQKIHDQLGTASLVDLVTPEPAWLRSLNAIMQLAGRETGSSEPAMEKERLIWELTPSQTSVDLDAYHQKRKGSGWTKGRKVARRRLYEQYKQPAFQFLSDEDRLLCQALEQYSQPNGYGYTESYYEFNGERAARALIGHPRIFPIGDREHPYEIVDQQPKLIVTEAETGDVVLMLDPQPLHGDRTFCLREDSAGRIAVVFFSQRQIRLHQLLGGKLRVPRTEEDRVVDAIQPVSSIVAVHSEIGSSGDGSLQVAADPRPQLHLVPYQEGLRVEFFVRPFDAEGPLCRPGQGVAHLVTSMDGQPKTARRDLAEEQRRYQHVIDVCPVIAAHLVSVTSACLPAAHEALEALIELEDLLAEQAIVAHWPQGRSLQLAGQATPAQLRVHLRKDRDWFAASGELKVDPTLVLDMVQLLALVEASPSRFVKLDDGRFLALTEQLRQQLDDLAAYGERHPKQNKLRFPRVRAAVLEELSELATVRSDQHWKNWVQRMRDAANVRPEVPSTLQTELRDYQLEGFQWLARLAAWGVGACLADDMGLGKTIEALALLLDRAAGGPALIVVPTSIIYNWLSEAARFAPTLNTVVFGDGDRAAQLEELGPRDVLICSYGLLHSEAKRLAAQSWHTVILDEAQAIKNVATRRSQAAMKLQADFRLIMTGTPLENHLGELWNLMEFINPGLLGSAKTFQERYAMPIERDGCRETRRRLKKLIQPFILRRTKSQVLAELPPRTEITIQVKLSEEEIAFYEALRRRAIENLAEVQENRARRLRILAEIMRLRRACCHPRLVLEDTDIRGAKLELFSETIDELIENRHKALVFSQFVGHLAILREELERRGVAYQYLDGSTPTRQRRERVAAFQRGEGDVFLISLKAGGLGLNLTAADYVIHMDPWWNPAVEDQASDRAHRLGQLRPVTIYRFITQDTIEQKILELHASKRDLADSLLEGTDMSGKLSAEQLLNLIKN